MLYRIARKDNRIFTFCENPGGSKPPPYLMNVRFSHYGRLRYALRMLIGKSQNTASMLEIPTGLCPRE